MATFPKMTLDEVIRRLQHLRETTGGDVGVVIRGNRPKDMLYIDAIGAMAVGKSDEYMTVSRGGTPVIRLFAQGE